MFRIGYVRTGRIQGAKIPWIQEESLGSEVKKKVPLVRYNIVVRLFLRSGQITLANLVWLLD